MLRAVLVGLLAVGCHRGPKLPDGDVAQALTVPALDAFDPATLRGKPALVVFVKPTCPYCLAELPRAVTAAAAHGAGLVAVFVAGGEPEARGVVAQTKFTGAALLDDGTLMRRFDVHYVPYTLVLGPDGHARDAFEGEQELATLDDALR